jgi:hypothetical protein
VGVARRWRDRLGVAVHALTNDGAEARTGPPAAKSVPPEGSSATPRPAGVDAATTSLDDVLREAAGNRAARANADGCAGPG